MTDGRFGTREEWREARIQLLDEEKELTRRSDELARKRRELPWVPVENEYRFGTQNGPKALADLFDGRSQLLVFHFMFAPDWEAGCPGCSFTADHLDGAVAHLAAAGVSFVAISRAPLEKLEAYRQRMGWSFPWVSSFDSEFNFDFGVSFTDKQQAQGAEYNYGWMEPGFSMPEFPEATGLSAFVLDDDCAYHTYSAYHRGTDVLSATWQLLDRTPFGRRDELGWMLRHDEYETPAGEATSSSSA